MAVRAVGEVKRKRIKPRRKRLLELHPISEESIAKTSFEFEVRADKLRAKPRMTRADKWKKRPIVESWLAWKDLVAMTYRTRGGRTFMEAVAVGYEFWLSDERVIDLDNIIKGINDALNGLAWPDDRIKYVREYDYAKVHYTIKGNQEMARIRIRPIFKGGD